MFQQMPGASAAAIVVALTPALLRWWWGRALASAVDDPLLPERLATHNRRVGAAAGACGAALVIGWTTSCAWGIPLLLVAQMVTGYPFRKLLYQETWTFAGYASFFGRMLAAMFAFWMLLAWTPSLASMAGGLDWLAGIALASLLVTWNHYHPDILRWLLRTRPITEKLLVERFETLVARCGLPMPRFEYVPMCGGVVANAIALPSLRRSSVVFTDTLLSRISEDETIAICAHELAHLEYYDRARLRRLNVVTHLLIAVAAGLAPIGRLVFHSRDMGTASMIFVAVMFVALVMRAKHRQKNETVSDLRAVVLTGDPEALVRGLTTLHAIARVPRRWDQRRERQATHPSLARRIRDIRAAAGLAATPLEAPQTFRAANGVAAVTFEDSRLGWHETEGTTHLLDYGALVELRLHATAAGAVRLITAERRGRRWEMPLRAEDVSALQSLLDRVDGKLSHDASARTFSPAVSRLVALFGMAFAWTFGQLAFGFVALLAALVPTAALINAAGTAALTTAAVLLRDGPVDGWAGGAAICLTIMGTGLLAIAWAQSDDTPRAATLLASALGAAAAIAVLSIALGGLDPIRLHQGARSVPAAAVLLSAIAAACFTWRTRPTLRYAAAAAAVAGLSVAAIGSTLFLDVVGRDPFLVTAAPVTWTSMHVPPIVQFDIPFEADDLRLSPGGALVAIQPTEPDDSPQDAARPIVHLGRAGETLTPFEASDVAFVDDRHALLLVLHGGSAELQEVLLDSRPLITWRQPIDRLWMGSVAIDTDPRRWIVTGRDADGQLIRATGVIGGSGVQRATWNPGSGRGGWVETFAVNGDAALVVERQYVYGPFARQRWFSLLPPMTGAQSVTQFWRLRGAQRIDQGRSLLDARCNSDALDEGRIACTAYDGTRTHIVAIDSPSGAVTPLMMIDGRFTNIGTAARGWLTGLSGSRPVALRLGTRDAIRAPAVAAHEFVEIITATDAVIGTIASTETGSRVRVYPLPPAGSGATARLQ
jgi:Zn-dependent protease with chaperone function